MPTSSLGIPRVFLHHLTCVGILLYSSRGPTGPCLAIPYVETLLLFHPWQRPQRNLTREPKYSAQFLLDKRAVYPYNPAEARPLYRDYRPSKPSGKREETDMRPATSWQKPKPCTNPLLNWAHASKPIFNKCSYTRWYNRVGYATCKP
jgi:hypothetical protein